MGQIKNIKLHIVTDIKKNMETTTPTTPKSVAALQQPKTPELDADMYVFKRNGAREECHFDKITSRIKKLCYGLNTEFISPYAITCKVIQGMFSGITTVELDTLAAEIAASMTTKHPDYARLAARIAISNLHKETKKKFSETIADLYNYVNPEIKKSCP